MDSLSGYQICDTYLVSSLSIAFVGLFLCLKSQDPWSEQIWLKSLVLGWAVLETTALTLSFVEDTSNVELPRALRSSVHVILATTSMCGVANIQIIAITYAFAVPYVAVEWWKVAVILECVEVPAVITCALSQQQARLELAYIMPFTSQIVAIVAIFHASRGKLPKGAPKRLANYLLVTGLLLTMLSLLLLGLSLAGFLPRLAYVQCGLFMLSLTIGFRPNERSTGSLTRRLKRRWFAGQASRHDSYQSLPAGGRLGPLPPPNAHIPEKCIFCSRK